MIQRTNLVHVSDSKHKFPPLFLIAPTTLSQTAPYVFVCICLFEYVCGQDHKSNSSGREHLPVSHIFDKCGWRTMKNLSDGNLINHWATLWERFYWKTSNSRQRTFTISRISSVILTLSFGMLRKDASFLEDDNGSHLGDEIMLKAQLNFTLTTHGEYTITAHIQPMHSCHFRAYFPVPIYWTCHGNNCTNANGPHTKLELPLDSSASFQTAGLSAKYEWPIKWSTMKICGWPMNFPVLNFMTHIELQHSRSVWHHRLCPLNWIFQTNNSHIMPVCLRFTQKHTFSNILSKKHSRGLIYRYLYLSM